MRSGVLLTVAAATAATFGGGLASAGTAAATTAPLVTPSPPAAPPTPMKGITGIADGLDIADGWCIAPTTPLPENLLSTAHGACGHRTKATDDGIHLLESLCLVPISLADGGPGHRPCDRVATGSPAGDDFSVLRGASVAGIPLDGTA